MPTIGAQLGLQAGSAAIGAGMGMLLGNYNDRRQLRQQEKLNEQQYVLDTRMGEANYARQMRMWHETGPAAQMAQLKAAGLNPALMYKQGGPTGSTAAATGAVNAKGAPTGGMEISNMMAQTQQMALMAAQIENMKANTNKTNKEAGIVEPMAQAEIENLKADTANKGVEHELLEAEDELKSIELTIAGANQNVAIAMAKTQLRTFTAQMHTAEAQQRVTQETADNNIKIVAAQYAGILAQNIATKTGTRLTEQQIEKLKKDVEQRAEEILIHKDLAKLDREMFDWSKSWGKVGHDAASAVVDMLIGLIPGKKGGHATKGGKH